MQVFKHGKESIMTNEEFKKAIATTHEVDLSKATSRTLTKSEKKMLEAFNTIKDVILDNYEDIRVKHIAPKSKIIVMFNNKALFEVFYSKKHFHFCTNRVNTEMLTEYALEYHATWGQKYDLYFSELANNPKAVAFIEDVMTA